MTRVTYPATCPGTNIIKSQHNAFNWQADTSDSIFARDYVNCSSLFNQWRSAQRAGHGKGYGQTWAEFRDANAPRGRNVYGSHQDAADAGFKKNRGTIHGLSAKADAMIAQQTKLLPVTASAWNGGVIKPPHGGAFSKASTRGGDAKIHKPAKARKVAA